MGVYQARLKAKKTMREDYHNQTTLLAKVLVGAYVLGIAVYSYFKLKGLK